MAVALVLAVVEETTTLGDINYLRFWLQFLAGERGKLQGTMSHLKA